MIAQAPSALWEYLSSSVHGRNSYHFGIYGDVSKWQVRRANAIARNFASRLNFAIAPTKIADARACTEQAF